MSRLDDILDSGLFTDSDGKADYRTGKVKSQIKELYLELIGEDEPYEMNNHGNINARNYLRALLRQKVESL